MSSHRVLLVEDDRSISEMVGPYLEKRALTLHMPMTVWRQNGCSSRQGRGLISSFLI